VAGTLTLLTHDVILRDVRFRGAYTGTVTLRIDGDTPPDRVAQKIVLDQHLGRSAFFVNLSEAANAAITDSQGRGTITNDDTAGVSLSIDDMTVTEGNSVRPSSSRHRPGSQR